ncbi:MAG TPA: ParB-like protein, partial [Roseiarcus sp.]|nr:ParB-like protein [Roseiarcus sp.]
MTYVVREPVLHSTSIDALRPTQMTVGMLEVLEKRKAWRGHEGKKRE